jgi:hypothetical protein
MGTKKHKIHKKLRRKSVNRKKKTNKKKTLRLKSLKGGGVSSVLNAIKQVKNSNQIISEPSPQPVPQLVPQLVPQQPVPQLVPRPVYNYPTNIGYINPTTSNIPRPSVIKKPSIKDSYAKMKTSFG